MFEQASPGVAGAQRERVDAFRAGARRVLKDLFNLDADRVVLSDETTLLDLAEDAAGVAGATRIKQLVYANYGITCEADEPLVDVLARLATAERGVRYSGS